MNKNDSIIALNILERQINAIKFTACDNIKVGDVLHYQLFSQLSKWEGVRSLIRILRNEFICSYTYKMNGCFPCTVMLFSNEYKDRLDHLCNFEKVCTTLDNYVKIIATSKKTVRPVRSLKLTMKWIKQFKRLKRGTIWSMSMASRLQQYYCSFQRVLRMMKKNNINIKNIVSYCDVMPEDNFFIQMSKTMGIRTITLQHGVFEVGHYGYTHSKSDFFLAHNLFSKDNAIKSGMTNKQIYIVGMPGMIDFNKKEEIIMRKEGIIGLILAGTGRVAPFDLELVRMAIVFKKKMGCKVYVKFHPGYGRDKYPKDIWDDIDKTYEEDITAYDFSEQVDFTVDTGSSLFMEYALRNKIAFTYIHSLSPYQGHNNIQMCFSDYGQMETLFLAYYTNDCIIQKMIAENMRFFSTEVQPYKLYKSFFNNCLLRNTHE